MIFADAWWSTRVIHEFKHHVVHAFDQRLILAVTVRSPNKPEHRDADLPRNEIEAFGKRRGTERRPCSYLASELLLVIRWRDVQTHQVA